MNSCSVLNRYHVAGLMAFCLWVSVHWVEHLAQVYEVVILGEPPAHAHGALGSLWPSLITSEWLHFTYVALTFVGLVLLTSGFNGEARWWWTLAMFLGGWHVLEHAILLAQALTGHTLFGQPAPVSLLQLIIPRLELHLTYNTAVTIPMVIALVKYRRSSSRSMLCQDLQASSAVEHGWSQPTRSGASPISPP